MTEGMKAQNLGIVADLAEAALQQIGCVVVGPDDVEMLGTIVIDLKNVMKNSRGLGVKLMTGSYPVEQPRS